MQEIDNNALKMRQRANELTNAIFESISALREIKASYPELKCAHYVQVGSILNAYREGDLTFDEASDLLEVKVSP